ncbi:flagellar rod assembly protein/muramidase FlgJ [Thalassotalea insulae]|uniref:Peptidoglycan hydrolase FlgJ n=1 Tax=Thalassotalea insulae TaxID=2056778 RepID=A0ABQ6GPV8_9GAMM|nr:flagellar assembly peptidoglycan hydrolase FlgJ [Thalassotalea insulae]GLX77654.1 flagellar rod assembly protein/muramidase FlgJ [Thalassotalea insulae]
MISDVMTNRMNEAQNYLDLNGLNSIRQQSKATDKASKDEALATAAKQFEAIFMQMLLKSMRSAQDVLEADSPFNSQSTKFYRDMHDQQLALELSNNGSLGLSDLIVRQLGGDSENYTPSSVLKSQVASFDAANKKDPTELAMPERRQFTDYVTQRSAAQNSADSVSTAKENVAFKQPQDFVSALTEPAKRVEQKLNVPFQVVIAQAALETGWGQKIIKTPQGQSSNNLFNIKADSRWSGDKAHKETLEYQQGAMVKKREPFRVYQNISESINDYIDFLSSSDRYQGALEKAHNVEHFLHGLQSAGYATDPNYAKKIMATLQKVSSLIK